MAEITTQKEKMRAELQDKFSEYNIPVDLVDTLEEYVEALMEDFLYRLHRSVKDELADL